MQRSIVLLALFVVVAVNADGLLSFVPNTFRSRMPSSARSDLASLSVKDFKALAQVARHASQFTSFAQMHQAVQKASPQFVALAKKRTQQAKQHYAAFKAQLSPSSQNFFGQLNHLAKQFANQAVQLLKTQDAHTKKNLAQSFHVQHLLATPAAQTLIQHYGH
ncbi:hypothetical protein M3Y98_00580800 [Aphelenchoides besseyi]|nr:hypothetical protein M3Y98_00580800 [Aphelenchoides besseyi]KAI6193883.1 hypothetical protein M3Y96_01065900 [Aphelenchoides besseyi]